MALLSGCPPPSVNGCLGALWDWVTAEGPVVLASALQGRAWRLPPWGQSQARFHVRLPVRGGP